ncbi:MAG TPA: VIT1/CCC1 transporter family protein [Planctomycetota bacterium]|nr:VIT1/CCC1 transporter family protein [Planctomycetota bacterium]
MKTEVRGSLPRLLDPVERFSEILFGLIMVLTFTGSLGVAEAGKSEIRTMLIGAFGCNVAWGIVDAVMYLMSAYAARKRNVTLVHAVRRAKTAEAASRIIAEELPPTVAAALSPSAFESIRSKLGEIPEPEMRLRLDKGELLAALAIFAWVVIVTCPVLLPFLFVKDTYLALRLSNGVAIAMLFVIGSSLGKYAGLRPWRVGLAMVFIGALLVVITMALGG